MTLAAQQVTDALADRLVPMGATGGRVIRSRTVAVAEADLPCWRVVAGRETVQPLTMDGVNRHELEVFAAVYARDTTGLDAELSALIAAGQALLFAGTVPYGLQLAAISREVVPVGEASAGAFTLELRAIYVVAPNAPETLLST